MNVFPSAVSNLRRIALLLGIFTACLTAATALEGDAITGSVLNQTTGQAAAGEDVVLLRLQPDMSEVARTKTDEQGKFVLHASSANGPYVVRVSHQGVNYDHHLTAGKDLALIVFDVADKLPEVTASTGIVEMEADNTTLHVREMYAIENSSNPPRTQQNVRNFEMNVPENAVLDAASVAGPGGIPVTVQSQQVRKGLYRIDFPLRPGQTRFVITYHLPYQGRISFRPRIGYGIANFAVMVPQSMSFKATRKESFHLAQNSENQSVLKGVQVEVANQPVTGAVPEFEVSGAGTIPPVADLARSAHPQGVPAAAVPAPPSQRPKDTVAAPASSKWSGATVWVPSAAFALILLAAWWKFRRKSQSIGESDASPQEALQMKALQKELSELERDHQRGTISEDDYASVKATLSKSIERATRGTQRSA